MNGVHCHASAIITEMYGQKPSSVKFVVTGRPARTSVAIWLAGPIGCRRNRSQKPPITTGLMKSGITTSTIRMRRPRNGRSIASASNKPRTNSTATADSARIAVTLIEFHQTGSMRLSLEVVEADPGMVVRHREVVLDEHAPRGRRRAGRRRASRTRKRPAQTIRYLKCRSAQEETAPEPSPPGSA